MEQVQYNFDEIIERKKTNSVKHDALKERFGNDELLSLWVADMDFKCAPQLTQALRQRVEHGIFGYTFAGKSYYDSIINWLAGEHGWQVSREELSYIPGIVRGIAQAVECFTKEGDKIVIQPPVYHPFRLVPQAQKRIVVENPLLFDGDNYTMDLKGLEKIIAAQNCKMLILCNPHNPIGISWDKNVLSEVARICHEHKVLVVSDEIHAEIIHGANKHVPFATVSAEAAQSCITFMAPSKTFNLAGIICSYAIVKNNFLRHKFYSHLKKSEQDQGTIFSYLATEVAYTQCNDWRKAMIAYVWNNIQFVDKYLKENIPQVKALIPQASFLVWLDCRALNLDQKSLVNLFVDKAGLALNDGEMFGVQGAGFMRLNAGCSRSVLEKALPQLKKAIN